MGNQNSKAAGTSTPKGGASQTSLDKGMDNLASYPSFSKADTKESNKSFRGALRSKIPGKTDSPRASLSALSTGEPADRSDAASIRYGYTLLSQSYVLYISDADFAVLGLAEVHGPLYRNLAEQIHLILPEPLDSFHPQVMQLKM
jgi:hypothetical protein